LETPSPHTRYSQNGELVVSTYTLLVSVAVIGLAVAVFGIFVMYRYLRKPPTNP
jgi:hypothetical protein